MPKGKKEDLSKFVTTPKCEAKWIYLDKPNTNFSDDGGYEVTVLFDPDNPEHKQFLDELEVIEQELRNEFLKSLTPAKRKSIIHQPLIKEDEDQDGNETGYLKIRTKSKYPPTVIDSQLHKIVPPSNLGNGTVVKVGMTLKPVLVSKNLYITAYLQVVQLIDIKTFDSMSNMDYTTLGFSVEDGFVSEDIIDNFKPEVDIKDNGDF